MGNALTTLDQKQMSLGINLPLDARISDFAGDSWTPIIDAVRQLHAGLLSRFFVYGALGSGKSHLLSAICESFIDSGQTAIKLSLSDLVNLPTESLLSLESFNLIALDDMQNIVGHSDWEEAVFHLINRSAEGKCQLVFACDTSVDQLGLSLKDLTSRIAQAPSFKLPEGNLIEDRKAILNAILSRRQLGFHRLNEDVIDYLAYHGPTNIGSMIAALNDIEKLFEGVSTKKEAKERFGKAKNLVDLHVEQQQST